MKHVDLGFGNIASPTTWTINHIGRDGFLLILHPHPHQRVDTNPCQLLKCLSVMKGTELMVRFGGLQSSFCTRAPIIVESPDNSSEGVALPFHPFPQTPFWNVPSLNLQTLTVNITHIPLWNWCPIFCHSLHPFALSAPCQHSFLAACPESVVQLCIWSLLTGLRLV